jgi:hypothetical protein
MIRYMRNGQRDSSISFKEGEGFLTNFFRLLGHPASTCELVYLAPITAGGKPRKELAQQARQVIVDAFESLEPA